MKQFDKLIEISPYPVEIEPLPYGHTGGFWYGDGIGHKPYELKDFQPHISIVPSIKTQSEQTATLIHEIGHAIHYKRHCKCYTTDRDICEYHAEKFTLRFMLRYKLKGALQFEIKYLSNDMHKFPLWWQIHIRRLQSEKIWTRCLRYLAE